MKYKPEHHSVTNIFYRVLMTVGHLLGRVHHGGVRGALAGAHAAHPGSRQSQ